MRSSRVFEWDVQIWETRGLLTFALESRPLYIQRAAFDVVVYEKQHGKVPASDQDLRTTRQNQR